jgi:hypothetical protein
MPNGWMGGWLAECRMDGWVDGQTMNEALYSERMSGSVASVWWVAGELTHSPPYPFCAFAFQR